MIILPVKTRVLFPPKDDLLSVIEESLIGVVEEESIIVVTSKAVSIWQNRCIKINKSLKKDSLVKKEADFYINRSHVPQGYAVLTIKEGILIPMAGIDESNSNGHYILWPKKPFLAAKEICEFIKKIFHLKKIGVIISDSHTTPLRKGVIGIGLAHYGFAPLKDYRGKKDIFGRKFKLSQTNIVDSLSAAAVFVMGEGAEQTPLAVIKKAPAIQFKNSSKEGLLKIDLKDDIYAPLLKTKKWKKGKGIK